MSKWVLIPGLIVIIALAAGCAGFGSASKPSARNLSNRVGEDNSSRSKGTLRYTDEEGATGAAPPPAEESLDSLGYSQGSRQAFAPSEPVTGQNFPSGGSAQVNQEPYDLTFFENYGVNPFIATEDENTSTFGMDVDTASYTITRRFIMDGNMPDPDSIRTEEFINYFKQDYKEPTGRNVFGISLEGARSQFGQPNYHLLKIGVKAMDVSREDRPPANMVFVVDVSGSMQREDRLEQVKRSLMDLAGELKEGDRIGLVVYGSQGRVISEMTGNHDKILQAIDQLVAEGSTYAEEGLRLGYDMARKNYEEGKINRLILCSDGVANVGTTAADEILKQIKADADTGITLTCLGFGMGNYNDVLMEKLANHGDGMYYYIDSEDESERLFQDGATQMLLVLGSDAKVQVVFNEDVVDRFRQLGYENRRLNKEDFEDDTVDAGEVCAGQSVTALYEMRIKDEYQDRGNAEVATVKIRYMNFATGEIETDEQAITVDEINRPFNRASSNFQFTAGVAEFAEILKDSYWAQDSSYADVLNVVDELATTSDEREFVDLVNQCIRNEDV